MHVSTMNSAYSQAIAYAEQQMNAQIQTDADSEAQNNQEVQQLLGIDQSS